MRIGVGAGWTAPRPCVPSSKDFPLFTHRPALGIGVNYAAIGMAASGPALLNSLAQFG